MITRLKKSKKGFTLVELIVVIAIIAILAAVTVPLTMTYVNKAKVSSSKDQIETIKSNLNTGIAALASEGTTTITRAEVYDILKEFSGADKIAKVEITATDAAGNATVTITARYDEKGNEVADNTAIKSTFSLKDVSITAAITVTYDAGVPKATEA